MRGHAATCSRRCSARRRRLLRTSSISSSRQVRRSVAVRARCTPTRIWSSAVTPDATRRSLIFRHSSQIRVILPVSSPQYPHVGSSRTSTPGWNRRGGCCCRSHKPQVRRLPVRDDFWLAQLQHVGGWIRRNVCLVGSHLRRLASGFGGPRSIGGSLDGSGVRYPRRLPSNCRGRNVEVEASWLFDDLSVRGCRRPFLVWSLLLLIGCYPDEIEMSFSGAPRFSET
jgi:hypothetical protein